MRLRTFFLPVLCCGIIASAQTAPVIDAQALDGTRVHLPAKQQPSVLVLGFSRKASTDVMEWGKRLTAATWNSKQAAVYEAAMLASLPKPLRGLVVRSHAVSSS